MGEKGNKSVVQNSKINPDDGNKFNFIKNDDDVDYNLTINQIIDEIANGGEDIVCDWMREITKYPQTTDACIMDENVSKNRFQNILLYDNNRVKIKDKNRGNDYYHASYVDGYDKVGRYVLAQAPFDEYTESDFWRLVSTAKPNMIVLLAATLDDKGVAYIPQFWCTGKKQKRYFKDLAVRTLEINNLRHWDLYNIEIIDKQYSKTQTFTLNLIHYRGWTCDNKVPEYILDFRAFFQLRKAETDVKKFDGPIMIVCPTGTHRAAFFAAIDIIIDRINQEKRVGIQPTVEIISKQRYGSFIFFEHYLNLVETITKHCVSSNIVDLHMLAQVEVKKEKKNV
ncbi:Protein-tyrosine phosphatase, receptor/non-receptor type domain and Protein-tyrosine/Dual specificity phosphatase domain and Protein-tyrosine phosphatase, catalytic domain-containing protein [Strongyloides ratti]|uniref:Protein-tyrosine phosphatase, receptor/non-receptor type domain and Protein-tyrosine/Dual specificity phosphatase domain and Protein-tyrosine phosphatase, catalytic domain-containing protein n=1 Tax=Strongyloides ratti TaxID=34506 RepID=A0A090LJD1_STRRB|nr:Protein-tyrosine phosphatase, receptor/non-receptor type domain and Protein-tyrosine/Dual specificity phosphatase domain and Protein-tyrosine phosphatase, catalytic domain-containing protein [Strongyloides ratti]CEF67650.1 Protein-tyrosine phosphatase, receptor/non-receptor type domain and Protein-tyrosine/Dual specificity phosphatase domain and Protein-tyrosine phosphatase, catalytic domain-containing protein [Strongyloides ratti]